MFTFKPDESSTPDAQHTNHAITRNPIYTHRPALYPDTQTTRRQKVHYLFLPDLEQPTVHASLVEALEQALTHGHDRLHIPAAGLTLTVTRDTNPE
jgi:hypothetical protein